MWYFTADGREVPKPERCHLGDVGVDGKVILKWILTEIGSDYVDGSG